MKEDSVSTRDIGKFGENEARKFLENKGYSFVESNFFSAYGEIDLIMRQGDIIVFVEVKLRRGRRFGTAADAVNLRKLRKLAKTIQIWLASHNGTDAIVRFDVVEVYAEKPYIEGKSEINHIINAFDRFDKI